MVIARCEWPCALLVAAAAILNLSVTPVFAGAVSRADASGRFEKRELTPADAIATVRTMDNQVAPGVAIDNSMTSPDGQRYVIRLAYGDVQRNGTWVDLLTGRLDSLTTAARPVRCAHLLTSGLGSSTDIQSADWDPQPANLLRWITNHQIAFLWSGRSKVRQVMSVDLTTCKSRLLTHSPTNVYSFGMGAGGALIFNAQVPRPIPISPQLWKQGFTVSDTSDGWSILNGDVSGATIVDVSFNNEWFIQSASGAIRRVNIAGRRVDPSNHVLRDVIVDPKGRFAVTHVGLQSIPEEWHHYSDSALQSVLESNKTMPNRIPLQYVVIDLSRGTTRPLWNAPMGYKDKIVWSPFNDAILMAPTFLPPDNATGMNGAAAAEVDVVTGRYKVLPIDLKTRAVVSIKWLSASRAEILSRDLNGSDSRTDRFERHGDHWLAASSTESAIESSDKRPSIRVETEQDLNRPPKIFAIDSITGDRRLILDTNPHLQERFKLGRVERLSGTLPTGHRWLGQLIYPADYKPGQKYPLVIQSMYGIPWADEEFSLDGSWGSSGMGLGPSYVASYPGQLLATRNISVLQLELIGPSPPDKQADARMLAFETVPGLAGLSELVDPSKIALDGFSRNGYWVEYTLSHSAFPFAAAIAADNYDPSYFPSALANWRIDDAQMNGATAFGAGLQQWLIHAPGFNAEHIHTPLRMIGQSAGIPILIGKWEIYSRLRYLHKPVEMYMMPDVDKHPSHTPQNPQQIMAIQEGVIDWFSFWLTDREDPNPLKRAQYARWHAFRDSTTALQPQG